MFGKSTISSNRVGQLIAAPVIEGLEPRQLLAATPNSFTVVNLVSDGSVTANLTDTNLVNGWGVAINQAIGAIWISDNGTGLSTAYTGAGAQTGPVVTIPTPVGGTSSPTGVVYNSSANFKVSNGTTSAASNYLFCTEQGAIAGWSFAVDPNNAILAVDKSADGAIYKGLTIAKFQNKNLVYAADFHNGKIDIFKGNFSVAHLPGSFSDPKIPAGYAPFNIQNIDNQLYVTYAQQDSEGKDDVHGAGKGFVDVFNPAGVLIRRFTSRGKLNAPWGVVQAPKGFGPFAGDILVGNFGDGRINVFHQKTGKFSSTLKNAQGTALTVDGLWGMEFGNGINAGSKTTLFYAAGPGDEAGGLFGTISPT